MSSGRDNARKIEQGMCIFHNRVVRDGRRQRRETLQISVRWVDSVLLQQHKDWEAGKMLRSLNEKGMINGRNGFWPILYFHADNS